MKKAMKKSMFYVLTMVMLAILFVLNTSINVQAAETEEKLVTVDLSEYILQTGGLGGSSTQFMGDGEHSLDEKWLSSGLESIEDILCYAWTNRSHKIDVSAYKLSGDDVPTLYWYYLNLHPEMFFVNGTLSYSYGYGEEADYVEYIWAYYLEEYTDEHVAAFEAKVDEIIAGVDESWPDIEKALYLHDYLATYIEYDFALEKYDAYNALMEGSCVCQGYTLAYICLLNEVNVNVDYIVSKDLNHAWNLIELNGEYFYTDVTWDSGSDNYCSHSNFMVSKQGLVDTGHDSTDWILRKLNVESNVYNTLATSSKYMDSFWRTRYTTVPLTGTKSGYLSDGKIKMYDFNTDTTTSYDMCSGQWGVWASMVTAGNAFYYTTNKDIYRMDLDGTTTKVYTLSEVEAALGDIYELISGETLLYSLATEPYGDVTYVGSCSLEDERYVSNEGLVYRLLDYDEEAGRYTSIQIVGYEGTATELEIPNNIDGYIVASITDDAFDGSEGLVLKGYKNSYVESYATRNGFTFEQLVCKNSTHKPEIIDMDCSTARFCTKCDALIEEAKEHDFSDFFMYDYEKHWCSCQNSGCMVVAHENTHTQAADDGDCTTEVLCEECDYVVISAFPHHSYDGRYNCDEEGHWYRCYNSEDCHVKINKQPHYDFGDDGDCSTPILCWYCDYEVIRAQEHEYSEYFHNGDEESHYRLCLDDNCNYIEESEHVAQEDDGNPATPVLCKFCDYVMAEATNSLEGFVTRMYQQCLSRDPDQSGLEGWVGQLENGNMNGAQIAEQFVFSAEMLAKNLSNEEFVNVLYRAMMGREADAAGRTGWVNELNNGYLTRSEVTKCFVESTEFTNICAEYGITRGDYDASMAPIEHFVTRFYTLCLERDPDQEGMYGWVNNLKHQYMNGAQIAEAFIFSDEFVNKNVSDEKYVELLYNTLLGRPSDENGKKGWVGELQNGSMTRRGMMKAFIESTEFTGICEEYGITRGTIE